MRLRFRILNFSEKCESVRYLWVKNPQKTRKMSEANERGIFTNFYCYSPAMQDDTYEGAKFQPEILSRFRVDRELHTNKQTNRTPWMGINIRDDLGVYQF